MKNIILVVDDDKTNLILAQKILSPEYRIAACNSGMAALKYLEKNKPHLILLDISMPEMDGFEVLEKLRQDQRTEAIPIIFLTADGQSDTEVKCFQMGALDFVKKPFVPDILLSRVAKTIELDQYRHNLEDMVSEQAEKLMESTQRINRIQETVIVGMANLIESRDGSTGKHVKNTQMYVRMISKELQKRQLFAGQLTDSYIDDVCKAAPLHDVGKIKISDAVLQKPGKLTPEEYEVIKLHTTYSRKIIQNIIGDVEDEHYVKIVEDIAMYHHERWDGTGYPTGLAGDRIPLAARIMAVADVFDALVCKRVYKEAMAEEHAFSILREDAGKHFDPVLVDVFFAIREDVHQYLQENTRRQ